jgi:uncharacterized protein YsxB (DUF464 family)
MIFVNVWRDKNGYINQYRVTGHAEDTLVCAAVSALTQTAVYGLNKICKCKIRFESSYGLLHVSLKQQADRYTHCVTETMLEGIIETSKKYKGAIEISDILFKG